MPLADDNKHQKRIPVNVTDREFMDASDEANRLDKKLSEIMRYALRLYLYGTVGMVRHDGNQTNGSD